MIRAFLTFITDLLGLLSICVTLYALLLIGHGFTPEYLP